VVRKLKVPVGTYRDHPSNPNIDFTPEQKFARSSKGGTNSMNGPHGPRIHSLGGKCLTGGKKKGKQNSLIKESKGMYPCIHIHTYLKSLHCNHLRC
jgi:hypothetical protein